MLSLFVVCFFFFFFNDTATTEIYTLSLHDALPIRRHPDRVVVRPWGDGGLGDDRSEEHTSELQSLTNLVCRLLLEKKKKTSKGAQKHWQTSCVVSDEWSSLIHTRSPALFFFF